MSNKLEDRSDEENQRNLERFSPLMYQLKKSGESASSNHSMRCDIVGQEVGAYPYPSGDKRESPNEIEIEEQDPLIPPSKPPTGACFKPTNLL